MPRGRMAVLMLCAALLPAASCAAQAVDLSLTTRAGVLTANLSFQWDRMQELVSSLRQGLESRITFTARVYEKRRGILPLMGDRMLAERRVAHSAFWDFLDGRFVVESDARAQVSYASVDDLLKGFFTLSDLPLYAVSPGHQDALYVTARAQFEPVRLMPPLTLVSMVGRAATSTSPWTRREAP